MRTIFVSLVAVALGAAAPAAQPRGARPLTIYVVDVEGGNATLFVAPSGESVLIDTGNPGPGAVRDAERIAAAAKDAGISRIDHLITTHWHGDHFGAMAEVAARIPVKQYIDHGPNVQPGAAADEFLQKVYPTLYARGLHMVVKPGDRIPVAGLDWRVVASAGDVLKTPLSGAGRTNPACEGVNKGDPDLSENAQSVSSYVTFGTFHVVHMGDLTWNKELELMCPSNRIGAADLFIVSHHGQAISNSPALVHALRPRVMILNNGTRKGGQPDAMKVLHSSPGLEDLWQMHFSLLSGQEYTSPGMFIANMVDNQPSAMPIGPMEGLVVGAGGASRPAPGATPPPPPAHDGPSYWVKVTAEPDGTFTVTNARNSFSKTYRNPATRATR